MRRAANRTKPNPAGDEQTFSPERRAAVAKRIATVEAEQREKERNSMGLKPEKEPKPEVGAVSYFMHTPNNNRIAASTVKIVSTAAFVAMSCAMCLFNR